MRRVYWLVLATVAFMATDLTAEEINTGLSAAQIQAIDQTVDREMKSHKIVGCAIGILRDGKVVFTRGFGYADAKSRKPVTTDTVFNWASNSKPLIAMAAMQLVQEGKLNLNADVRTYVPGFPAKEQPILVRHLLCHQSGIPHYSNGRVIATPRRKMALDELDPMLAIHRFDRSPLLFEPGAKMEYSSYAYVLLSAVVQSAAGRPIADQIKERITSPLGMSSFQLDLPMRQGRSNAPQQNWSLGYTIGRNGRPVESPEEANYWKHGAGGYKSNINDFARWAQAVMTVELLDESTNTLMWTPQQTISGTKTPYGLGPQLSGPSRSPAFKVHHNGNQKEVSTRMVLYPHAGHGMVIMANVSNAKVGNVTTAIYRELAQQR